MKINKLANMLGVNWKEYGWYDQFEENMKTHKQSEYYVYREKYVLTNVGKIKEPSIYEFNNYFTKIRGNGHSEFGARTYDNEYEIFLTRESALEYAIQVQKQFFEQKEKDNTKKTQNELN